MIFTCLRDTIGKVVLCRAVGWGMLAMVTGMGAAQGAEPEFVGVLALALEDEVAESLELSESTRVKMAEVVDRREDEALELALELMDLPADERTARLAPFRAESERQGLVLLTAEQRRLLRATQITRLGMDSLAESDVVDQLGLSESQQAQITQLLQQRSQAATNVDRQTARNIRASYERKLSAVLTEQQRSDWDRFSELTSKTPPPITPESPQRSPADAARSVASGPTQRTTSTSDPAPAVVDGSLLFNFQYAPWKEVLDWFAIQADLSLVADVPPPGTFNYTDNRRYAPPEALDLLNSVLLTKGYTLVRRDRMLMLIYLEDGIPPNLVLEVTPDQLDERGQYELVRCLFPLERMSPEDAEAEISKLLGPQGSIVVLPTARQVLVTETAGRLRTIRRVIQAIEDRQVMPEGQATVLRLVHVTAADVLATVRPLLGLAEDEDANRDRSLRIAADPSGSQLLALGQPDWVRRLSDLVQLLDVPPDGATDGTVQLPQLEVYSISTADPTSVLQVMQTLLAGMPDTRLASDPKTGNLVALARPTQHRTIRATIDQMQRDARQIEVIRLWSVDPEMAVASIGKLFGFGEGQEEVDPSAPRVDADPVTRSLMVRATQSQIEQIRDLLEKMGETEIEAERIRASQRGNVRMLPISGFAARRALEQAGLVWPTMRQNRIRTVTPSAALQSVYPSRDTNRRLQPAGPMRLGPEPSDDPRDGPASPPRDFDSEPGADQPGSAATDTTRLPPRATFTAEPSSGAGRYRPADAAAADIMVAPGPRGTMIASEDLEALDQFEQLLRASAGGVGAGEPELAVFYLRYAKAEAAAEHLKRFLGTAGVDRGGAGGSLLGNLAGAALGESGGGLLGSLLGLAGGGGGGSVASGSLNILADTRLNALLVQATPEELDLAAQLLEVIDQNASPEQVETIARPRLIPVLNMGAAALATIVREVYATRIAGPRAAARQPSPDEFMRALRGQAGDRSPTREMVLEQERMTISVDARSNSLVVSAPDPLFQEVVELVALLDQATTESEDTMRVVTIKRANPEMIQRALASMLGGAVTTRADARGRDAGATASSRDRGTGPPEGAPRPPNPEQIREQMRRRIEFFRALQQAGQGGRGQPGGRGRQGGQ